MSHLLAISVGPVQEFIAAARRTHDLWFGSYLLSEVSRAVAKSVQDQGGKLIFPASLDAENVANVILAELDAGDPKEAATKAKDAARKQWWEVAEETRNEASGVIRAAIWEDQVDDVIEFYAAWVLRSDSYQRDRARVMRLLGGRKNCRDFLPAKGRAGVPKSSLDGQRESVLKDPAKDRWPERFQARLRIREGEQLDVVGLVKRVAGGKRHYPSVARIAADPWVRGNKHKEAFQAVLRECENLGSEVVHCLRPDVFSQFQDFPYEGTAVYPTRHHEWREESELTPDDLKLLHEALKRLPQPEPYLAVLVADGDKMGAAISNLEELNDNQRFSKDLANFASEARTIINAHNGVLVYAGGDDVLAFLPVDKCLDCARELRNKFVEILKEYKNEEAQAPTLSVGIAIGHFMENLEDLLEYGRAAEKSAKMVEGKDALAVHLHKRGGSPIKVRARWNENPDERLTRYAELIRVEAIPSKLPYDLRKLADHYKGWRSVTADEMRDTAEAMQGDMLRVIRDKQPRSGRNYMPEIERIVKAFAKSEELERFTEQLLVARQIATALKQAGDDAI